MTGFTIARLRTAVAGLRACLGIAWGPAARGPGHGQGGEAGASALRAGAADPAPAPGQRPAARRAFALALSLLIICGCAHTSIQSRQAERREAYLALSEDLRRCVDRGELAVGMDTNAVYLAWGKPGEVREHLDLPEGREIRWRYYRSRIRDQPKLQIVSGVGRRGGIEVYTIHQTVSYRELWREAAFRRGRAYWWRVFDPA